MTKVGGYHEVGLDSEFVTESNNYFKSKVGTIFPEVKNTDINLVTNSAEFQVVNGYNIRLHHTLGIFGFITQIYVTTKKKFKIMKITEEQSTVLCGGYMFQDPDTFKGEDLNCILRAISIPDMLDGHPDKARVIMVRTQVVAGINFHVVLEDETGNLCSTVCYRDLRGNTSVTSFNKCPMN